jgi:hypothetical protein
MIFGVNCRRISSIISWQWVMMESRPRVMKIDRVFGLRQRLRSPFGLRSEGYVNFLKPLPAGRRERSNRMTIRASLPLPSDETYFLTKTSIEA